MTATRPPNFLFIITDQQRADYLGCAGHPVLRTPHIDRIARQGVRFDRFHVASPVCMANRATLMTGRLPAQHGVRGNGLPLSLQANTFVDVLRQGGYRTALVGKSHLQNFTGAPPIQQPEAPLPPGELAEALKPYRSDPGLYDQEHPLAEADGDTQVITPFYGFDHVRLTTGHGDRVGGDYRRWLRAQRPDAGDLIGPDNALPHDFSCPQAWRTAVPEELYSTSYIAAETEAFIRQHADTGDGRPFFLMMSFPDPHHPFTPPGRYWDLYRPEDMVLPESFHAVAESPPEPLRWVYRERGPSFDRQATMSAIVVDEREAREAIALTCGMMAMIDDAVGRALDALEAAGLAGDTVVVFTADHGDFLGDRRLLFKDPLHYQSLLRVPFLWGDPALERQGVACDALCGTVDAAPTVLARAGLAAYNGVQGRSLLPELRTLADHGPQEVLVQEDQQRPLFGLRPPVRVHSLVAGTWRLTLYDGSDWAELYDLAHDPLENENLWGQPAHRAVQAELLERFARRQIAATERSPLPSGRA